LSELQKCRADAASGAVNQHALSRDHLRRAMQHLVRGDVVEDQADRLGGIDAGRHRNQIPLRQADVLRVRAEDRQRGDELAWLDFANAAADSVDDADNIPARREGYARRLGMDAFAHHHVRQRDARGQHLHARFTVLRLRTLLFDDPELLRPAVARHDDARVAHRLADCASPGRTS
jgi:hypothetical protein